MVHYGAGRNRSYEARIGKLPEAEQAAALHARSTSLSSSRTQPANRLKIDNSNSQSARDAKQKEKYLTLHPDMTEKKATQSLVRAWVAGKGGWKYAEHATKK